MAKILNKFRTFSGEYYSNVYVKKWRYRHTHLALTCSASTKAAPLPPPLLCTIGCTSLYTTFLELVLHYSTVCAFLYPQISSLCIYETLIQINAGSNIRISNIFVYRYCDWVCIWSIAKTSYPQDQKIKYIWIRQLKWMAKIHLRIILRNWICPMQCTVHTHIHTPALHRKMVWKSNKIGIFNRLFFILLQKHCIWNHHFAILSRS